MSQDKAANNEQENQDSEAHIENVSVEEANETSESIIDQGDANESQEQPGIDWQAYADELEKKLSAAEQTIESQKDSVLRAKADGDNAKRRAQAEIDKARKFALEKFAGELLSVVDNLERAITSVDAEDEVIKPFLEGVEMTQKSLLNTLDKFGIKSVDPQGEAFNPDQHQAMSMQENDEVPANTVIAVMQKGYLINERLLRPAMVMVSRGGASKTVDTQA